MPSVTVKPGYQPQAEDTSIAADVLMFQLLRQLSSVAKAQRVMKLDRAIRQLSPVKNMIEDPISLAQAVGQILDSLQIRYYVGGSLASSLLGEPRYSEDLDLVIEADVQHSQLLVQAFQERFYISDVAVAEAIAGKISSFNIISLDSGEKVDLFVIRPDDPFALVKLDRRFQYELPSGGRIWVSSAEDMILQKLIWRRNNASEKQWRDIVGILKTQGEALDYFYLQDWAKRLDIVEALAQAMIAAGI